MALRTVAEGAHEADQPNPGICHKLATIFVQGFGQSRMLARAKCKGREEVRERWPYVGSGQRLFRAFGQLVQNGNEHRLLELHAVWIPPVDGPYAHIGQSGDVMVAGVQSCLGEGPSCRKQHSLRIALRVGTKPPQPHGSIKATGWA